MQFVDEKNIPGLLLLIDLEKAYDSLSLSFMKIVLKSFNLLRVDINILQQNTSSFKSRWQYLFLFTHNEAAKQGDPRRSSDKAYIFPS